MSNVNRSSVRALLVAGVLGLGASHSQASLRHSYSSLQIVEMAGNSDDVDELSSPTDEVATAVESGVACTGSSHSRAARKRVQAYATSDKPTASNDSSFTTSFADTTDLLTLHVEGPVPGGLFTVTYKVFVSGSLDGACPCQIGDGFFNSMGAASVGVAGGSAYESFGSIDNDPSPDDLLLTTGEATLQYFCPNDVPVEVILSAFASGIAAGIGNCTADATADVSSLRWMGVTSVTDPLGNPVASYTLTDEHGFDWTTPALVADLTSDDLVDVDDLLLVINSWGMCPAPCPADLDGDGDVDVDDLLIVINDWT